MKINKVKLNLINLIYLFFIILIIYLIYILIISLYNKNKNKEKFVVTPTLGAVSTTAPAPEPSTLTIQESCKAIDNVVDFCINYDSCCSNSNLTKACFCNHPITLKCKAEYDTCISDTSLKNLYTEEQLKQKCASQQKNCCIPYNSISLSSNKFDAPIKNEPNIKEMCSVSSIRNLDQKCLELCQTNPECKAYSVNVGKIVQSYGECKLYDTVSILDPQIDPLSGKPKYNIATDYYVKK